MLLSFLDKKLTQLIMSMVFKFKDQELLDEVEQSILSSTFDPEVVIFYLKGAEQHGRNVNKFAGNLSTTAHKIYKVKEYVNVIKSLSEFLSDEDMASIENKLILESNKDYLVFATKNFNRFNKKRIFNSYAKYIEIYPYHNFTSDIKEFVEHFPELKKFLVLM